MKNISRKNRLNHPKPLILAVESSGRIGSVAVGQGPVIIGETAFSGPMRHGAEIFPALCDLLGHCGKRNDQIEQVYISIGPGSFTGLRIAVTIAKMMSYANNTKIIAVDTMDAIAANVIDFQLPQMQSELTAQRITKIATILDAKRGQFYIAVYQYQKGRWQKTTGDCLMGIPEFLGKFADVEKPVSLLGEGLVYYQDAFKTDGTRILGEKYWQPKAKKVLALGWEMASEGLFSNALTLQPAYLRGPDAKPKQR